MSAPVMLWPSGAWFGRLKLLWKLLIPLVGMTVAVALAATFLVVRHLTDQAEDDLDNELARSAVIAEAHVRDVRLSLVDGARLTANLSGMATAVANEDRRMIRELLASVAAVRHDLELLVVADLDGTELVVARRGPGGLNVDGAGDVGAAAGDDRGAAVADAPTGVSTGFSHHRDRSLLTVSVPIRQGDTVVGVSVVGIGADTLAGGATERAGGPVAFLDVDGRPLTRAAAALPEPPREISDHPVRVRSDGDDSSSTLFVPVDLQDARIGQLAVSLPTDPAFSAARGARNRLVLLLLAATAGIVVLGALIARRILRQVRPLVATNRALGRGDLGARAPVIGDDELAELARGFNEMAEQLEASQQEVDLQVQTRTEELTRLAEELQAVDRSRSREFAEIVHELRNHLVVIGAYAEFMEHPELVPREEGWAERYGRSIGAAAAALDAQMRQILELARRDAGPTELELEEVNVRDVILEMEGTIMALARRGDLDAEVALPAEVPLIRADRVRLNQILLNLVSNAVKYTPPGGQLRVETGEGRATEEPVVEIHVVDTGMGIPLEVGDDIFEPFYRTQRAEGPDQPSGTGLGLAVVKRLVEEHGGSIRYQSRVGEGSRFTVAFPALGARRPQRSAVTSAS